MDVLLAFSAECQNSVPSSNGNVVRTRDAYLGAGFCVMHRGCLPSMRLATGDGQWFCRAEIQPRSRETVFRAGVIDLAWCEECAQGDFLHEAPSYRDQSPRRPRGRCRHLAPDGGD